MQHTPNFPVAETGNTGPNLTSPVARRSFLRYSGAGLAVGGLWLAGCSKDSDPDTSNNGLTDVGTGDIGILNYAYALEQLEAAFYAQVVSTFYAGATAGEKAILTDLRDHEGIHRDFFKGALGTSALALRTPDFSGIDFAQKTTAAGSAKLGVLDAAKAFEDLGVAAYNGAGRFITSPDYLTLAGKIVSVEARHAAAIRELLAPNTFVANDVVDLTTSMPNNSGGTGTVMGTGQERSKRPPVVLATANMFLAANSRLSANSFA